MVVIDDNGDSVDITIIISPDELHELFVKLIQKQFRPKGNKNRLRIKAHELIYDFSKDTIKFRMLKPR